MNKFHKFPDELPETGRLLNIIFDGSVVLGVRKGGFYWDDDDDEGWFYWKLIPAIEDDLSEKKLINDHELGLIRISHWAYVPDMRGIDLIPTQNAPSVLSKDQSPLIDGENDSAKSVMDSYSLKAAKCMTNGEYESNIESRGFR
jgi:hypothetical protein